MWGRLCDLSGRQVLPEAWDGGYTDDRWHSATVVRVHPWGARWSVWRWHDGAAWRPEWYINLERIEGARSHAVTSAEIGAFPFRADWTAWIPDPDWPPISLPPAWADPAPDLRAR